MITHEVLHLRYAAEAFPPGVMNIVTGGDELGQMMVPSLASCFALLLYLLSLARAEALRAATHTGDSPAFLPY